MWQPLQKVTVVSRPSREVIDAVMRRRPDMTEADAIAYIQRDSDHVEYWVNDLYVVGLRRIGAYCVSLSINRNDGEVIYRDWRHFQEIKNQLLGEECEAVELYPAESRLVDAANQYHLFGVTDPSFRFSFGFTHRMVADAASNVLPRLALRAASCA